MERLVKNIKYLLCIAIFLMGCKNRFDKYIYLDRNTDLDIVVKSHINDRGGSILNEKYILPSYSPIIKKKKNSKNNKKEEFYFLQFQTPYRFIKKNGKDVFLVVKSKDTIKFQLLEF